VEQGWNRIRFLEEVCQKAGLPPGTWKAGAGLHRFTAEVFQEGEA
jgi:AMMECR1 domain-containing protein